MKANKNAKSDVLYLTGIITIVVEFLIYLGARKILLLNIDSNDRMLFIFINHAITIGYLLTILIHSLVKNRWRFLRMDKRLFISFITLAYISAHTLNEEIGIFSRYPLWLKILLISIFVCLHLIDYIDKLPGILRIIIYFVLGFGTSVIFYFSVYLGPFIPIGIIGIVFFALTIYLFTPLILLIVILYQFFKSNRFKIESRVYLAGVILPFIFTGIFLVKWHSTTITLSEAKVYAQNQYLPEWVILGQNLSTDDMTLKVLSSNLRYDNLKHFGRWSNNLSSTITEEVTHDPLVIIAQLLLGEFPFDDETCLKIIEYQYDARHEVYRKLWSGKDLETKQVVSNIQVYPDYRLAYVEKTITIANNNPSNWSQQEALYTFTLPEGSVASSLSLWIDGKEEKSRLTTKSKADSAYTSIVGYEMRDPALLHWQEGNTITVTIFPCTPAEERIFKIGLTVPLKSTDNQLLLDNITFKGPNFLWTDEISTIEFFSNQQLDVSIPSEFDQVDKNKYIYKGLYDENKMISMKAPQLSSNIFSFNNKTYHIQPNEKRNVKFNPKSVFLDINKSWSKDEFNEIFNAYQNKQTYVFDNQLIQLNKDNKDKLFNKLNDLNFSLFPLHAIKDMENSLLITKSTKNSPDLNDLKSTRFGDELSEYLSNTTAKIKFADIGNELSPYLRSLKEFEVFDYWSGTTEELIELSNKQVFPIDLISDNEVAIESAKIKIVMENQATVSNAPDHLMRLFAYNQIMKITGRNYFNNNSKFQQSLIDIANEAHVVSPISSLVVLETVKDYERFDIQKNENSLQNAVKNSSGSVPEPHEWALIILSLLVVTYLYFKKL